MIKKVLAVFLMLAAIIVSGCGEESSVDRKVAIAFPNTTPSWQRNGDSMKKTLEDEGFTVDLQFSATSDEQVKKVDELLDGKPSCLVIGAIDGEAFVDVLNKAKEQQVPVIAFDRIIKNTDAVNYYA